MSQRVGPLLLLPLLILTTSIGSFMSPVHASIPTHSAYKGQPHFLWKRGYTQPQPRFTSSSDTSGNVSYHGGPVQVGTAQVFVIFWEPTGTTVSSRYNSLLKRYFQDVGGSSLYHNNTQYTDQNGNAPQDASSANTWVDTAAYPSTPTLFDSDIRDEIVHAMNVNGWTPGVRHVFFVYLASNETLCFDQKKTVCSAPLGGFCSYHFTFTMPGSSDPVAYAAMPYDGNDLSSCYTLNSSPNNDKDADAEISTTSHEQMETATNPLLNGWYDSSGSEIADKCAFQYKQINSDGSNVNWNGHPYIVQSEWDNAVSDCVLSGP